MKPPTKNLIGGVEELHTREYLFKISARMIGCRERSKIASRNSKNARTGAELMFLERKRERGSRLTWRRDLWAPGALWARPGGRLRQLAAWATGGPPWSAPGASGSLPAWKFLFLFFWSFAENFTVEIFSKFKKQQNFLKT